MNTQKEEGAQFSTSRLLFYSTTAPFRLQIPAQSACHYPRLSLLTFMLAELLSNGRVAKETTPDWEGDAPPEGYFWRVQSMRILSVALA
jgi:hypothetical protein